jgi:hypothetical protein
MDIKILGWRAERPAAAQRRVQPPVRGTQDRSRRPDRSPFEFRAGEHGGAPAT